MVGKKNIYLWLVNFLKLDIGRCGKMLVLGPGLSCTVNQQKHKLCKIDFSTSHISYNTTITSLVPASLKKKKLKHVNPTKVRRLNTENINILYINIKILNVAIFMIFFPLFWGLIYKMLRRNHPKFDYTIISRICIRLIHRLNVRTENTRMRLFQM